MATTAHVHLFPFRSCSYDADTLYTVYDFSLDSDSIGFAAIDLNCIWFAFPHSALIGAWLLGKGSKVRATNNMDITCTERGLDKRTVFSRFHFLTNTQAETSWSPTVEKLVLRVVVTKPLPAMFIIVKECLAEASRGENINWFAGGGKAWQFPVVTIGPLAGLTHKYVGKH